MPRPRLQFHLTNETLNELKTFIIACYSQRPPDSRTGRRAQIIRDLHQGWSIKGLSQNYRVSKRSIRQWLADYRRAGIKGLMGKPRPGVHLTEEQVWQLIHLHSERPKKIPQRLSQRFLFGKRPRRRSPWSYPRLAQWAARKWGIKISPKRLAQIIQRRFTPLEVTRQRRGRSPKATYF